MTDSVIFLPTRESFESFGLSRTPNYGEQQNDKNNPFLTVNNKPYTQISNFGDDTLLNEVLLEAFDFQPVKVVTKPAGGGLYKAEFEYGGKNQQKTIGKFRILLNTKEIAIKHTHGFTEGSSILKNIFSGMENAQQFVAQTIAAAGNTASNLGATDNAFASPTLSRVDFQQVYTAPERPRFTIDFMLITNNDFMRDIYAPVMALTLLTYPKRIGYQSKDESSIFTSIGLNFAALAQDIRERVSVATRQYSFTPPCMFNVYHQSGLYAYANCYCKGLTVNYSGPWYNADASVSEINMINNTLNVGIKNRTFPSVATISMEFESQERLMRDDFILQQQSFNSVLNSGKLTFGQNQETTPIAGENADKDYVNGLNSRRRNNGN